MYFRNIFKLELNTLNNKINRGFVAAGDESDYCAFKTGELLDLLKSPKAQERTIAARCLGKRNENHIVEKLLFALDNEKKLYPKIEICNSLARFGNDSVTGLVQRLGKIGKNQYKTVPIAPFVKNSFPLPRDIAARTLIRIGKVALPSLLEVLNREDISKISEAVDSVGFICFKNPLPEYLGHLLKCYRKHFNSDLIRWKIYRAMSAFQQSRPFLEGQLHNEMQSAIIQEIRRSLKIMDKYGKII